MNMQDKEFDEHFRSKLEDFEVEPSAKVWPVIDEKLSANNRRRILLPVIGIAATLLILGTAGLFFVTKDKSTGQYTIVKGRTPKNYSNLAPAVPAAVKNETEPIVETEKPQSARNEMVVIQRKPVTKSNIASKQIEKTAPEAIETPLVNNEPVLAELPKNDLKQPVLPETITLPADKPEVTDQPDVKNTVPVLAAQIPKQKDQPAKKHRIRSFGDLINVVVAKIDKRPDKIIHFTDSDDDDESNVSAVNLGIVKVKKDNN